MKWFCRALAAAAVVLTGCAGDPVAGPGADGAGTQGAVGGTWAQVEELAGREGAVTLYTAHTPTVVKAIKSVWGQRHPDIALEVVRGLPQDLVPRLEAERLTGRAVADVFVSADAGQMTQLGDAGYFARPVGPNFEAEDFAAGDHVRDGGQFISHVLAFGVGWNTSAVPQGLSGYAQLLDPTLADGRIAVVEPSNQSLTDFWLFLEEQMGENFIKQLAGQQPRVYPGSGPIQEALAAGEIDAALYAGAPFEDAKAAGAPIDWMLPGQPFTTALWAAALDNAPHPNAAQVLIDFFVSSEGQAVVAAHNISTRRDVPGTSATIDDITLRDSSRVTAEMVQTYGAEWRDLFQ